MADCKNCIHIEVCKSADSCDGRVPGCRHFEPKTKHWWWDEINPRKDVEGWIEFDYQCSACKEISWEESNYCPNCGAIMDLPIITDKTMNALEAMDRKAHGGE